MPEMGTYGFVGAVGSNPHGDPAKIPYRAIASTRAICVAGAVLLLLAAVAFGREKLNVEQAAIADEPGS